MDFKPVGTLDFHILNALSLEPMNDVGIEWRVNQKTRGFFNAKSGSFLLALNRLERAGWVDSDWRLTEGSSREKIYSLSHAGKEQLGAEWERRRSALAQFVEEGTWPAHRLSGAQRHSRN